ncbi:MAG: glycosyltransferase, partial [Odoribacter sp.]|nr:glycosyltransferase [Odoribacter sp.]
MNSFAAFWESLGCDKFFLILGGVLFIAHIILLLYRYALLVKKQQRSGRREKVSVIITCSNKAELLKENLVAYLEQDYPSFEVIVVDECSEDDTQEVLSEYQKRYPHSKTTRIFPDTKFRRTKKIAIHIGVLAATYDILLFAEINARPNSKNWIGSMQSYFDRNTAVVLGYANYAAVKG